MSATSNDRSISLMAKAQYLREVRWIEPLAQDEEDKLLQRVERGKRERLQPHPNQWILNLAKHARDQLIEAYQSLVVQIAASNIRQSRSMELLDLVQEGNFGLIKAIEQHDATKGFPLRTLAGVCIRQAIYTALRDRDRTIRIAPKTFETVIHMRQMEQHLFVTWGREPSLAEIAQEMHMTEKKLAELLELSKCGEVESLQGSLEEGDAEERFDFLSLFEQSVAAEAAREKELEKAVQDAIKVALNAQQQQIIRLRYGLEDAEGKGRTQAEVAKQLGCATSTVFQHECRAKEKLREVLLTPLGSGEEPLSA